MNSNNKYNAWLCTLVSQPDPLAAASQEGERSLGASCSRTGCCFVGTSSALCNVRRRDLVLNGVAASATGCSAVVIPLGFVLSCRVSRPSLSRWLSAPFPNRRVRRSHQAQDYAHSGCTCMQRDACNCDLRLAGRATLRCWVPSWTLRPRRPLPWASRWVSLAMLMTSKPQVCVRRTRRPASRRACRCGASTSSSCRRSASSRASCSTATATFCC